jgi:hypothetical protein
VTQPGSEQERDPHNPQAAERDVVEDPKDAGACGASSFSLEARVVGGERKEISRRKESETQNSGAGVEIMVGAVLQSPTHHGKQMKCFADMSKHDDDQTPAAEQNQIPTGSGEARFHDCGRS